MRLLLADDHDLLRDMIAQFLQAEAGVGVTPAATLGEALERIAEGPPFDLVLLDYNMPGMDGLDGLARVLALPGGPRAALLSGEARPEVAREALALGAAGFVPKTLPARSLVSAVRFMALGETYVPLDLVSPPPAAADPLSVRERDILRGLLEGKSNKAIARDMALAEPTIKMHLKTLFRKIGVANRTQAALKAREERLI